MALANFSDRIRQYRTDNGISQIDLAKKLGVSKQTVSAWETSKACPPLDRVPEIAETLGVPIWWIYGFAHKPLEQDELEQYELFVSAMKSAREKELAEKIEINNKKYAKLTPEQLELKMKTTLKAMELLENKIIDKQTFDKIVDD